MSTITYLEAPAQNLGDYIHSYTYRHILIDDLCEPVKKIIPPNHLVSLDFFFDHPFRLKSIQTGLTIPFKPVSIRGCRTKCKYELEFEKSFASFSIKFTPNGLYKLLGLDMSTITNEDIGCTQLNLPIDLLQLHRELSKCASQEERITLVESCFLKILVDHNFESRLIYNVHSFQENDALIYYVSTRQQQRLFKKEIGLSPKSYHSLQRFSSLLKAKKRNVDDSWTSLAHQFGYFDQSHLIKDFYTFLGIKPSQFNIDAYAI